MIPKAPCLNCQNIFLGCHDTCEKYLAFRKERDIYNEKMSNERELRRIMDNRDYWRRRR